MPCDENEASEDEKLCRKDDSEALLLSPPSALTIELKALCNSLNWLLETELLLEDESEESALISEDRSFFIGLSDKDDELDDAPMLCNVSISVCRKVATASFALEDEVSDVLSVEDVVELVALVSEVLLVPSVIPMEDKALVSAANNPPSWSSSDLR